MNKVQQEQLFTELTSAQAETTAGGRPFDDGGLSFPDPIPFTHDTGANAFYGRAFASLKRQGLNSFSASLRVKDELKDGHPVYALFQGLPIGGGSILNTQTKRFDFKGAAGDGTDYPKSTYSFSKPIGKLRLVIMRQNPGRDLFVAGPWMDV
ncbi:hypothetical protein HJG54_25140 [Leptolyngbya sp. NK1-12]|uniref:Uncharacterized protein n=1 Tax=Leptolyngbya sp. NK1-12 TaxID=2547451 RepID=A0AA96WP75_9CYAN|nr:hypothetical protein [Leptolyngbya sp. NK1-12]WNZ25796.1 hypothetical protein HJG54_25140 [Leptolyngbya sp. NK1-12]